MPTITVKNIPPDLYDKLKETAVLNRRSLNREIIVCIERAVSSRTINPEAFLTQTRKWRDKTKGKPVSDRGFTRAKAAGRL
jgi:antitoxin FitA